MKKLFTIVLLLASFSGISQVTNYEQAWNLVEANDSENKSMLVERRWITIYRDETNKVESTSNKDVLLEDYRPTEEQRSLNIVIKDPFSIADTLVKPTVNFARVYTENRTIEYRQQLTLHKTKEMPLNPNELFKKWYEYCNLYNINQNLFIQVKDSIMEKY